MNFTEEQIERYSRHIILPEVGGIGQQKLLDAKVFCLGAGGLGSPALMYLAAAGVGTLGVADGDVVDMSNLQRQIIHNMDTIGVAKVESARRTIENMNPDIRVNIYNKRLTVDNIQEIIREYDIILDGSDNFPTRFLMNDACFFEKKTLISGSMFRFDGQVTTFKSQDGLPCYRCLYPEPPPEGMVPSCQEAGVLGALPGVVGVLQATEAIKEILGIGDSLAGYLMIYDALSMSFKKVKVRKDPECPICSENATIKELSMYEERVCAL
ncbi:MAG: molybdopterin-synthase adenylyltransferase MoeB [Proteobacteria bacterium]|nr:molybdopterin-synthase adenylyltransferase MoeB [Pseudomonadota bacterium]